MSSEVISDIEYLAIQVSQSKKQLDSIQVQNLNHQAQVTTLIQNTFFKDGNIGTDTSKITSELINLVKNTSDGYTFLSEQINTVLVNQENQINAQVKANR